MKRILFFIFLFILSLPTFSQRFKIDSLLSLLKKDKEDTNKVNHLNVLAWELSSSNPDTSIILGKQALSLSEKTKSKTHIANSYHEIAWANFVKGNYPSSLENNLKALKLRENLGNKSGIAVSLGNIGNVYADQADYPKALDYYFKALKIKGELGDKNGIATWLVNIGIVYMEQSDYPKALDYYFKALKMAKELGHKQLQASTLNNIGIIYWNQRDYPKALDYYFKALKMAEELGDKQLQANNLTNIGITHSDEADKILEKNNFIKKDSLKQIALDYYSKALKMAEELGFKQLQANTLGNMGSLYTDTKKYTEAEKYLSEALKLDKEIGDLNDERQLEETISKLYTKTNRYQLALEHYKKAMILKDTLFSADKNKEITRKEMNFEFDKKEAAAKAEQDRKDTIAEEEKRRQKIITYSVSGGLLLVLLLAMFIFRGYRQKQKANKELAEKNTVIAEQKKLVEEKNKDITDSINYAKRIQEAVLIPESEIKKQFSDAFVLFKPKDIVSGDIYWFAESKYNKVLVVADCTGHGVPGGFMSMLSFAMLQETLLLEEVKTTAQALTYLDHKITETLNRNNRSYRDGMDMTLCAFSKSANTLQFSCANRPLILIRNGELKEFASDKFTIGGAIDNVSKDFRNQEIQIEQEDLIYLFSDGYADQFGGSKGKKFKHKQLNEKLLAISHHPLAKQKEILEQTFNNWKGTLEQVDDVCIIGIKCL